jgi:CheY-like chemotaxis protein
MATILVADDEKDVRKLIADIARLDGHAVTMVADGRAALHACFHTSYDLVITDLQTPEVTGADLLAQLRAVAYRARTCIISGSFASPGTPLDRMQLIRSGRGRRQALHAHASSGRDPRPSGCRPLTLAWCEF